jgi:hypothetical protein
MNKRIFLCGLPGTGKSTFGRWLRDHRGFVYVDLEAEPDKPDSLDATAFREPWEAFVQGDRAELVRSANLRSVVFDWGFPVSHLSLVRELIAIGFVPWWFDGDRLVARQHFVCRNTVSVEKFDIQSANISAAWATLLPSVGDRIVKAARTDGSLMGPEDIAAVVFGDV